MTLAERLKNERKKSGLSQKELADKLDMNARTYASYERGERDISTAVLLNICKVLEISSDVLLGNTTVSLTPTDLRANTKPVPLVGRVAAGLSCHAEDNIEGYILTDCELLHEGYDYFWLTVKGDSMEPELHAGDLILVRQQDTLENECFAVVTQPIYYVFFYHSYPKNMFTFITHMNVMYTLAVALLVLFIVTHEKLSLMFKIILAAIVSSFAQLGDWSLLVPAWTLIFFFFNRDKKKMYLAFLVCSLILLPYLYLKQFSSFASFSYNYAVLLALIPITMYNGQRISNSSLLKKKISKWFFYIYYPLHMMILYLIFIKV